LKVLCEVPVLRGIDDSSDIGFLQNEVFLGAFAIFWELQIIGPEADDIAHLHIQRLDSALSALSWAYGGDDAKLRDFVAYDRQHVATDALKRSNDDPVAKRPKH